MPLYIKYRLNGAGPKVKLRVLEKQSGLIGARLAGAEWSTSDIIVFLGTIHILRRHFEGKGGGGIKRKFLLTFNFSTAEYLLRYVKLHHNQICCSK